MTKPSDKIEHAEERQRERVRDRIERITGHKIAAPKEGAKAQGGPTMTTKKMMTDKERKARIAEIKKTLATIDKGAKAAATKGEAASWKKFEDEGAKLREELGTLT